jgi:hypothetical protein
MKDDAIANTKVELPFQPSTLETIDSAMFYWLDKTLDLRCNSNEGFIKPPIIWVTAERAFITKRDQSLRDDSGTFNLPILSLARVSMVKDFQKKGGVWGNVVNIQDEKGGSFTIARIINQDKSTNFGAADNKAIKGQINFPRKNTKVVYQTITIPHPVYVELTYNIIIRTIYQQQMNELIQPFITKTGGINCFSLKYEGHKYEAFIDKDFADTGNIKAVGTEERKFESTVSIRVLGYLIGEGINSQQPKFVYRENAVDVKFARERIIVGDINQVKNSDGYVGIGSIMGRRKIQ